MSAAPHSEPGFRANAVGIVGVGLIGGSLAAALKARGFSGRVIGLGRSAERLNAARDLGLIDEGMTDSAAVARQCDLLVVCTPVDRIASDVRALADHCRPGTLLTDAGSVKGPICKALETGLPPGTTFIGSHPLAGSEKQGFEHARGDLYAGRVCVLTPTAATEEHELERLRSFWTFLGARLVEMTPEAHDEAVAMTSHAPHVVASALAAVLPDGFRPLAAAGFRDTTRIAAGDPDLWVAIVRENRAAVLAALERVSAMLGSFHTALEKNDPAQLRALFELGKTVRDAVGENVRCQPS